MMCLLFGVIVATATWPWLGPWAALAGLGAAAGLFLGLKFWPTKSSRED